MKTHRTNRQAGFSLTELVMVMVLVGIVATYAVARSSGHASTVGSEQAAQLARDLRHTQMLAATWGKPLVFTATANGYSVACATAGAAPCNVSPVIDPARGAAFSVDVRYPNGPSYPTNASLTAGSVRFDSLGRPSTGVTVQTSSTAFTLSAGGISSTVTVNGITGLVE
jgi:prepilin-type N-terminal cleavage/methylation domain-containing protein